MFDRFSFHLLGRRSFTALLLCGSMLGYGALSSVSTAQGVQPTRVSLPADPVPAVSAATAQDAAITFVRDLSDKNPDVWRFATEEEQEGFAQERDAVTAFSQAYPPLANATELSVAHVTAKDDDRDVAVYVKDSKGLEWLASMHLWLDDAGDWKVVDCTIQPAPDYSV